MSFDWSIVWTSMPRLLEGAWMTIWLACVTMLLAIPGGLALALLRLSNIRPLAMAATAAKLACVSQKVSRLRGSVT